MSPLNLACLLCLVGLVVYFATKGAPSLPGGTGNPRIGRAILRRREKARFEAKARKIDDRLDRLVDEVEAETAPPNG